MKSIPLTQGKVALVDDADYEWLVRRKWYAAYNKKKRKWYAQRKRRKSDGTQSALMHRVILGLKRGNSLQSDHCDNDGLNNQRSNLRVATKSQNMMNQTLHRDNRSGFKGVDCNYGKWRARITIDGNVISLGRFNNRRLAAEAYNKAAIEHFGEFALINSL